jgi:hypothetical protein
MFFKKFNSGGSKQSELAGAIYPILTGKKLLSDPVYREYIEAVSKVVNLEDRHNKVLYIALLEQYAQFVQQLEKPRDKNNSRLLHSSFRRAYGFIRQVAPRVWSNRGFGFDPDRLIYALFTAALLNGVGRTFQDKIVHVCDSKGKFQGTWFPNAGLMIEGHYRVRASRSLPDDYCQQLHILYAQVIVPKMGLSWILEDAKLYMWWVKALEDIEQGFDQLEIDLDIEKLAKGVGEEFNFEKETPSIVPVETLEGEKFLAWLLDRVKNNPNLINTEGSGLYHGQNGLLVEIDQLISEYLDSAKISGVSSQLVKRQFGLLGIASASSGYAKNNSGYLQNASQASFQAMAIDYEKGLFEKGALGPVLQVASQAQVTSGERFFDRIGGLARQYSLGHTNQNN